MPERVFTENAVISSKGQLTIPKKVREVLGVNSGEKVTFVVVGDEVKIVNAAAYTMKVLQTEMMGEAEKVGLNSEEDIVSLLRELKAGR